MNLSRRSIRAAFSMIELLVILAIIAILLAILLPAVQKVREAAGRAQTMNNIKQIAISLHNSNDVYKRLPPAYDKLNGVTASLHVHILPFVEQDNLYKQFRDNVDAATKVRIPTYVSPLDPSLADNVPGTSRFCRQPTSFCHQRAKDAL